MTQMTLTIERQPRTFTIGDREIPVEELVGIRLPFARKAPSLEEACFGGKPQGILVTETRELAPDEYDWLSDHLLWDYPWMAGKGGGTSSHSFCIEVSCPGRPILYINPEGSSYARYAARLG